MNPVLGWSMVAALFAAGWQAYGWNGVIAAATATVFWLMLQFNRALRVMKNAGAAPLGHLDSAVMLNARLKPGMTMLQVVTLTRSLGRKLDEAGDSWAWRDAGQVQVTLHFRGGKLTRHELERPVEGETGSGGDGAPATRLAP
jgi:hypothetical protein